MTIGDTNVLSLNNITLIENSSERVGGGFTITNSKNIDI